MVFFVGGCAAPEYGRYQTNSLLLVDGLTNETPNFVANAPIPEDARVAVVNLNRRQAQYENPSESMYDHLVIALTRRGVFVVERDTEALYASVLEGWSDRLPFTVSSPCQGKCPKSAPLQGQGKDKTVSKQKLTVGEEPEPIAQDELDSLEYEHIFAGVNLPTWYQKNGDRITASQSAATHVLAYRVQTLGTHLEPDSETALRRKTGIDIVLRLFRTKDGVVVWSERFHVENLDTHPKTLAKKLNASPFEFYGTQFSPSTSNLKPAPLQEATPKATALHESAVTQRASARVDAGSESRKEEDKNRQKSQVLSWLSFFTPAPEPNSPEKPMQTSGSSEIAFFDTTSASENADTAKNEAAARSTSAGSTILGMSNAETPTTTSKAKPVIPVVDPLTAPLKAAPAEEKKVAAGSVGHERQGVLATSGLQFLSGCGAASLSALICPPAGPAVTGYIQTWVGDRVGSQRGAAIWPILSSYGVAIVSALAGIAVNAAFPMPPIEDGLEPFLSHPNTQLQIGAASLFAITQLTASTFAYVLTAEEKTPDDHGEGLPGIFQANHPNDVALPAQVVASEPPMQPVMAW